MGYTNINFDGLQEENVKRMLETFLRFAKTNEAREMIQGVIEQGKYDNYSTETYKGVEEKWHSGIEIRKRIGMAYLISQYPETFKCLKDNRIALFHGTSSLALPGILRSGLKSFGKLKKDEEQILTGETWSRKYREGEKSANFVSMSDDIETILGYSMNYRTKGDGKFGVVIGINDEALQKLKIYSVSSVEIEVGIKDQIPLELISFIGVPEDKVELVKKMVGDKPILVMPMPLDINNKFYVIDDNEGFATIIPEIVERVLKGKKDKSPVFKEESYENLAKRQHFKGLLDALSTLKNMFPKRKGDIEKWA